MKITSIPAVVSMNRSVYSDESGLARCLLNSPSLFIPGLRILLGQTSTFHVILFDHQTDWFQS